MKSIKLFIAIGLFSLSTAIFAGGIVNNGGTKINIVMYNNFVPATPEKSARGRINPEGLVADIGQHVNFLPNTTSIDVFYGDNNMDPIHVNINAGLEYAISPTKDGWVVRLNQ